MDASKPLVVNKDGGDVDAITASTITTRAFLKAVNQAYAAYADQDVDAASGASKQVKADDAGCDGSDVKCRVEE